MNVKDILELCADRASSKAAVRTIFGDPIVVGDKAIVPVASVAYGFGAGGQLGWDPDSDVGEGRAGGGGGGGGVRVAPAGVLEITQDRTRFIAIAARRKLVLALGLGAALGFLIARKISA